MPVEELPLTGPDRAERVREMFGRIVPRYDVMNHIMTGGQDIYWRRLAVRLARPVGTCALDLATGTGDFAIELRAQGAREVVAADYCIPMVEAARRKLVRRHVNAVEPLVADALNLPFADASFDVVTSGFLLRNTADLPRCLAEMRRVLRPGGRAVALELTPLAPGLLAPFIQLYCRQLLPRIGQLISGDPVAYRYLPASVDPFPSADRLADLFHGAGFDHVTYRRVGMGTVAIHLASVDAA
ncbi:MAG: demethylmenaquinone methyltransferase / 2-methoxy-6-polyprenyl,4-benzoquinol methylase [Chloroflexota bacterium]|nr:demethylmenaquinone methyltransferase / 2-methoxy-6-polyprenyl,4-benzoquinol methylase [Chloroflexota bacterium]